MKAVQYFSDEYLAQCKKMKPQQILQFLEEFRTLHTSAQKEKSRLISIKIPEQLLERFKQKSQSKGVKYQTQIKVLMEAWLSMGS